MTYLALGIAAAGFALLFRLLDLTGLTRRTVAEARAAGAVVASRTLDDAEKEVRTRRAAIAMFGALASMLSRAAICLGLPTAAVWALTLTGAFSAEAALAAAGNWAFIAITAVMFVAVLRVRR